MQDCYVCPAHNRLQNRVRWWMGARGDSAEAQDEAGLRSKVVHILKAENMVHW